MIVSLLEDYAGLYILSLLYLLTRIGQRGLSDFLKPVEFLHRWTFQDPRRTRFGRALVYLLLPVIVVYCAIAHGLAKVGYALRKSGKGVDQSSPAEVDVQETKMQKIKSSYVFALKEAEERDKMSQKEA